MAPILAYWDVRGIVTPIRLLLSYADVRYEYKEYPLVGNSKEWFEQDKVQLGETLDFPNLPYYIDGKVQLTQTKTIITYLGKKYDLDGKNETEELRMSLIMEQVADMRTAINKVAYIPPSASNPQEIHEALKKEYIDTIPSRLERIAKFLGSDNWVAGNRLTYADFWVYDVLDFHRLLFNPKHFNAFPTLVAYMERVEGLKGVKEYIAKMDKMPTHAPGFARMGDSKDYKPTD